MVCVADLCNPQPKHSALTRRQRQLREVRSMAGLVSLEAIDQQLRQTCRAAAVG